MGTPRTRLAPRGGQHAGPAAEVTYLWSPSHCSGCVHGGLHFPVIRQHEHYCMLSMQGPDIPQLLCWCTRAGTSQEERARNKSK